MRMDWQELNPADPKPATEASAWAWTDLPAARRSRMDALRRCCDELGVPYPASREVIQTAYRRLVLRHHPDKADAATRSEAEERMKRINMAHQELLRLSNEGLCA
jgi:DnaJ-domain-containing protein 1